MFSWLVKSGVFEQEGQESVQDRGFSRRRLGAWVLDKLFWLMVKWSFILDFNFLFWFPPISFSFPFYFPCYMFHLLHLLKNVIDLDCTLTSHCRSAVMYSALSSHFALSIRAVLTAPTGPQQQFAHIWCPATSDYLKQENVLSLTRNTVVMWSGEVEWDPGLQRCYKTRLQASCTQDFLGSLKSVKMS